MSLDYQHIREQLHRIIHDYKDAEGYERGQSQNFWTQIFNAYGVSGQVQLKAFEHRLKDEKAQKYVDAFIPKLVMIEQKSRGIDLNKAYNQVSGYYDKLKTDKPRYIVLCNFDELWVYDIANPLDIKEYKCLLTDLPENAEWLDFLAPNAAMTEIVEENPINRQATEMVAKLHQAFISDGVNADELALFLTRLIFCFFADDTGIFGQKNLLDGLLKNEAKIDGSNLNEVFTTLFDTLNSETRSSRLPESYAAFAYINGDLFSQSIRIPYFDENLYNLVVDCNNLNWSEISPAIFGSMFQSVLDIDDSATSDDKRREFGAHYTSEKNILKVINSLFLQDLRDEFSKCAKDKPRALKLYEKLPTLTFFDPACGCGNFLIIAYRELRLLENQLIAQIYGDEQKGLLDISSMCQVTVEQFYGIEIEPHAAHIARVAMWITDHQLNQATAERFGTTRPTTPIVYSPHITEGNALQIDWEDVLAANECDFVMGNPPFIGKSNQSKEQKADMQLVAENIKGYKTLDYVAGWYIKAMHYMQAVTKPRHNIETAFVSTNSIVQGEQVAILWQYLLKDCEGCINFAHHTFKWTNEGKGVAAVHCVIVGYSTHERKERTIFSYDDVAAEPKPNKAKLINGYLVDAPLMFFDKTRKQYSNELSMDYGSMPNDGGNLLLSDEEYNDLIAQEPLAKKYIKPFLMGREFLNNIKRWCIWLDRVDTLELNKDLENMPLVHGRIEATKQQRLDSTRPATQKLAATPHLFGERRYSNESYIGLPRVSSENRRYIPIGFLNGEVAGDKLYVVLGGGLYHFGILSSSMHNAFMRLTAGRMKSDYSYSNTIVYNNFPYPFDAKDEDNKTVKTKETIRSAAQAVLDARKHYQDGSEDAPTLAKLYNTYMIDPYLELTKAHNALDKAVDKAYGYKGKGDDASRVEFLLKRIAEVLT